MLPEFRRNCRYVLLLLFLLAGGMVKAQTATVKGTVRDSTGFPIENAVIGYAGSTTSAVSDEKGNFSLEVPAGKPVVMIVHVTGYTEYRTQVNAASGETVTIYPRLKHQGAIGHIATITDTVRKRPEFIPPHVFDHIVAASGPDVSNILRFSGAQSNNEMSTQYSVRGGNYDENLVYVNGIEVYRPFLTRSGQQEGLSFVNLDMVGSLYFSAGGFQAKYGDKMASVLDITYREPTHFKGTASMGLLANTAEVEGTSSNHRFMWMLGIRNKSNRYLLRSLDTKGEYKTNFTDCQAFLRYYITDQWTIDYLGNYAWNRYNLVPQTRETDFGTLNNALRFTVYFDGQEINSFNTMFNAISLNHSSPKQVTKFIFSSFNTYETESFDVQGQYYIDQLEADFGKPTFGQVAFNRGVGTFLNHARNYLDAWINTAEFKTTHYYRKSALNYGLRYQNERINDQLSEWNMVDSAGYSIPYLPYNSLDLQDVVKSHAQLYSNRYLGYVQLTWSDTLNDSSLIILTAGIRAQYWDMNGQFIASPRAELNWEPHWKTDIRFRFAAGLYDQPPFYRELRGFDGTINRNIRSQTSVHVIAGSDLGFKAWGRPFVFVSEVYYKYLDNLIPYEINDVRIRYYGDNLSYGRTYGLDLRLNGEFVKGVDSWVNLSLLRTEENLYHDDYYLYLNSDGDTIIPGFTFNSVAVDSIHQVPGFIPRPTDQLLSFALYFQDYLPHYEAFKMNLGLIFGSGLPFGPPNHKRYQQTFRLPPYRRVDIGFSYQIIKEKDEETEGPDTRMIKSLWVGAEVYNLLQVQNTISNYWIKDVTGRTYAVPNYLTNRQLSIRAIIKF
jgi:hypothetical protein